MLFFLMFIALYSPFMLDETTFSEINKQIKLNLSWREKAFLSFDKRTCQNRKIFNKSEWDESVAEVQEFYIEFAMTYRRNERQKSGRCGIDCSTVTTATLRSAVASQDDTEELVDLFHKDSDDSGVDPNLLTESALHERDARNSREEFKRVVREWSRYILPRR